MITRTCLLDKALPPKYGRVTTTAPSNPIHRDNRPKPHLPFDFTTRRRQQQQSPRSGFLEHVVVGIGCRVGRGGRGRGLVSAAASAPPAPPTAAAAPTAAPTPARRRLRRPPGRPTRHRMTSRPASRGDSGIHITLTYTFCVSFLSFLFPAFFGLCEASTLGRLEFDSLIKKNKKTDNMRLRENETWKGDNETRTG